MGSSLHNYLMLTRRGHINKAQLVFESIRSSLMSDNFEKPDWARFIDQGVEKMARRFDCLGMGQTRAREIHAALTKIRNCFGEITLDPLRKWSNNRCLDFLCALPGVSLKTAACVMLYTLNRDIFPSDVHCNRVLARLGVLPQKYERQDLHKKAQKLLLDGRIPEGMAFSLHVSLVLHGQNICTIRSPRRHLCPVRGFCAWYRRRASSKWLKDRGQPSCVDLFSGAGGTSIGLSRPIEWGHEPRASKTATMRIALAAELDPWARKTYATNHPEIPVSRVMEADLTASETQKKIKKLLANEPNLVLVVGGPPCQNVSLIGKSGRRMATGKGERFDQRKGAETYVAYRDIVKSLKTRFFVKAGFTGNAALSLLSRYV